MAILEPQCCGGRKAAESERSTTSFYSPVQACQTSASSAQRLKYNKPVRTFCSTLCDPVFPVLKTSSYPNFAVIEIFAFNTFDTGQPFSAASAYF